MRDRRRSGIVGLGLVLSTLAAGTAAAQSAGALPHSLELWDNAARMGMPIWLTTWLGALVLAFLASLFFVRRHSAARWAIGGFLLSHLLVVAIEMGELATLRKGLVSWTHAIGWTPVAVVLARELRSTVLRSPYGAWCRVLLAIIVVALIFDYRDAGMYLYYQLTGHPGLELPG